MNFEEVLLPLDDNEHYICYTKRHPGFSPDDYRDISHAYAHVGSTQTDTTLDVLTLISLAIPAEAEKADMIRSGRDYMQQIIQQREGKVPEHELQSLEQQIYLADQLAKPSRALPPGILASKSGLILVCCENTHLAGGDIYRHFTVRLIDAINANVVSEVQMTGKDSLFNNVLKKIRKFGEPLAINPAGNRALFWTLGNAYVVDTQNKFKRLSSMIPDVDRHYAGWCNDQWVIFKTDANGANTMVSLLSEAAGNLLQQFTLKGGVCSVDTASEHGLILVGHIGGECDLIDTGSVNVREFKPHKTIKRGTFIHVRIADDGKHFATWNFDDQQLMLTNIASGYSYPVASLPITTSLVHQGQYARLNKILEPGFGFAGGQLLSLNGGVVTPHSVEAINEANAASATEVTNIEPLRYDATQSLDANIEQFGLQSAKHKILPYHWPAIRLQFKTSQGNIVVGESKLGGLADLPNNIVWPRYKNNPMVFFAQINLEKLSEYFPYSCLPANGLLSFFIGINEACGGPIPMGVAEEKEMWKVMHIPDLNALRRRDAPVYPEDTFGTQVKECSIAFKLEGAVFPNDDSVSIKKMALTDDEFSNYLEFIARVNPSEAEQDNGYQHQLLGYPYYIQGNDMELMCERGYRGNDIYTWSSDPEQARQEEQAAADWRLLLQLASDEENTDLLWGDAGLIYWFIRKQDLAQGNFENTWIQFQN